MSNGDFTTYWYVLKVKPLCEKKVYQKLLDDGFTVYLPLIETIRQWSDRKKKVKTPLISSIVFIKCIKNELAKFYQYNNIVGVLKLSLEPAVVKDFEIENLRIIEKEFNGDNMEVSNEAIEIDQRVEVIKGPFKGLIAVSVKINGKNRILVKIELLNAEYILNIPRSFIRVLN